mgnify:FL=1|jgi:hypothetical protein|tara:strand:- start:77 stop:400 length:324 start_codon:yes stop_codon:yes gene_type:complete
MVLSINETIGIYNKLYNIAYGTETKMKRKELRSLVRKISGDTQSMKNVSISYLNKMINIKNLSNVSREMITPSNNHRVRELRKTEWLSSARRLIVPKITPVTPNKKK